MKYYKVVYYKRRYRSLGPRLAPMGVQATPGFTYQVGAVIEPAEPPDPADYGACGSGIHVTPARSISYWAYYWHGHGRKRVVLDVEVAEGDVIYEAYDKVRCARVRVLRALTWEEAAVTCGRAGGYWGLGITDYVADGIVARLNQGAKEGAQ